MELSESRKQEMMDKVVHCLNLSKDQEGTPEGDTALKMAMKLMAKYRIAETELDFGNSNSSDVFENEVDGVNDKGGRRQWVLDLGNALAGTFDCRMYFSEWKGTLTFVGTEADLITVEYLFETVLNHINRGARGMWPNDINWRKRNVFGTAAMQVVSTKLWDIKNAMKKEEKAAYAGGTDLVVVKNALVNKEFEDITASFKSAKRKKTDMSDRKTWMAGRANGEAISLNQQIG